MLNRLYYFLFLFLISILSYSQDLIIRRDSVKIYCKIIKEDSLVIYYNQYKNGNILKSEINKSQVEKYFYSTHSSIDKKQIHKSDSVYSEISKRFHFGIFIGNTNPIGVFGKKNVKDSTSGFANSGITYNISAILKLSRLFGLTVFYINQKNNYDDNIVAQNYQSLYGGSFSSTSTPWYIKGFLGGAYFTCPIKAVKNLYLEMHELVGMPKFTSAGTTFTQTTSSTSLIRNSSTISSFAFITNIGLRYKLTNFLCVVGAIDFLFAKPMFSNVTLEETISYGYWTYSGTKLINFYQKIETYNLKLGLIVTFNGIKYKNY